MFRLIVFTLLPCYLFSHQVHVRDNKTDQVTNDLSKEISLFLFEKFKFNGKEHILYLGCKEGHKAALLSKLVTQGQVIGVDSLSPLIGKAQKTFSSHHFHNLSFIEANPYEFDCDKHFDVVFSFTDFQKIAEPTLFLKKMSKILKSNGTIALSIPVGLPLSLQEALEELLSQEKWRPFQHYFDSDFSSISLEDYKRQLENAGFEINLIEKRAQKKVFENTDQLIDFISSEFSSLKSLPTTSQASFIQSWIERYCELEGIEDQPPYLSPSYLVVIAHKK